MLSPPLGTISNSYFKNPGDLLDKINTIENKSLASLDIKSWYIDTPVIKCLEIHLKKTNIKLL